MSRWKVPTNATLRSWVLSHVFNYNKYCIRYNSNTARKTKQKSIKHNHNHTIFYIVHPMWGYVRGDYRLPCKKSKGITETLSRRLNFTPTLATIETQKMYRITLQKHYHKSQELRYMDKPHNINIHTIPWI